MATGVIERRAAPRPAGREHPGAGRLRLVSGAAAAPRGDVETARTSPAPARPRPRPAVLAARRDATALTALVIGFCVLGLVMVLSSSVESIADDGSAWSVFAHQAMWMGLGAAVFVAATRLPLQLWRRAAVPFLVCTVLALVAVLVRGIGTVRAGSARWIDLGPLRLQPSEFAKLAAVVFIADLLARRLGRAGAQAEVVRPVLIVLGVLAILVGVQPDLGTTAVIVAIGAVLLFAAGVPLRRVLGIGGLFAIVGAGLLYHTSYGRARIEAFLNPSAHASTTGYQVAQSLLALGSGHWFGSGIGSSPAAWGYLPNANSDFIYAIIGNNFGLVGAMGVLCGFLALGWLGFRIARRTEDRFASLVVIGVTTWIVVQAFINIGGVIGALPETGIPLPFVSAGGSSLVVLLAAMGLVVRIARQPAAKTLATADVRRARRRVPAGR
jgi:cell division protein FtsW